MRIIDAKYVKSLVSPRDIPFDDIPEICFIGRSNVGKSSLINALTEQRIARTSSRPGATKIINIYKILFEDKGTRNTAIFSDFPGFGYAKVSRSVALEWQKMIEGYLTSNDRIKGIIWLLDVRRDFDNLDEMLLDWLVSHNLTFRPVLTKIDKESQGNIARKMRSFHVFFEERQACLFSAKNGQGKKELLGIIMDLMNKHTD